MRHPHSVSSALIPAPISSIIFHMTQTVTIKQLQEHAGELLASLGAADEIIVSDGGKPLAKISSAAAQNGKPAQPRESGFWKDQIQTTPDFDQPLPDSFWLGEQ
jgi:antitoxin (DNA-binding transcriptional repressor) of toxin-antitoxin stability system